MVCMVEIDKFRYLYGLDPDTILQVDMIPNPLDGLGRDVLNVLDAAGEFHLQGVHLDDEHEIFEWGIELVEEGKYKETEEASRKFPFQSSFVELDSIMGSLEEG
ncbi:hypothetical protein NUU61_001120 [Penicillium alfredii]|uniref:Uncharacterized protein n=1 Tax=Penicillium alfredii TaxID=1506179 RepID=A0A9W9GAV9_9EURO|nr:uncharacterized protein NUU61_001120 [Penicillium alfredii]KAJ5115361.1 hypothetical protein NUU61_001120 [Penicillium alfredii]